MSHAYTPHAGSLAHRVCGFFARNRDDELSARDIATKFDVLSNSVRPLLAAAVRNGWLTYGSSPGEGKLYRAGPNLPADYGSSASTASAPTALPFFDKPPTKSRRGCVTLPELDVDALPVLTAPPKPSPAQTVERLLQRLQQPHQYVLLPAAWQHTVRKHINTHNRQARQGLAEGCYSLMRESDDQVRLQRIE